MNIDLLAAAKLIVALGGAAAVIWGIIKPIMKVLKEIDEIKKHQHETYMQTLRLVIMSEEMPLEERIEAGDKYIKNDGNGAVKHFYETDLLQRLPIRK